ncbi:hypothetical protein [Planotetraspora sp. GP83]|uniref:hypothetical protein n=1 Tax=Planotetraspora sp. GP83 TaxID=3156264 RepID=UPI003511091B
MTPSRAPDVIDALVSLFNAAPILAGKVLDGPTVTAKQMRELVVVGWDGVDDSEGQAVDATQDWAGLGAGAKDEVLTVTCAAIAARGDTDIKAARDTCYRVLLAAVENQLRANKSLGLPRRPWPR